MICYDLLYYYTSIIIIFVVISFMIIVIIVITQLMIIVLLNFNNRPALPCTCICSLHVSGMSAGSSCNEVLYRTYSQHI